MKRKASKEKLYPEVPPTTFTEREGIGYVDWLASQMGIVWREIPNTDIGIDGYLEVTVSNVPIGLIAVQVKSGPSYMKIPKADTFTFYAEGKHVRYWLSYRLPVIVIIYDPASQIAYWRYIQGYFQGQNQEPSNHDSVPIRMLKSTVFNQNAKERLTEIAASPDSTAHAMLALRANRYNHTNELLTPKELLELYVKRKWLGDWLPLDKVRERILFHSTLARRGPGWFWFRASTNREYISHLRDALKRPEHELRCEAIRTLSTTLQREAVDDLRKALASDLLDVVEALASISNLTLDDRKQILPDCFQQLRNSENLAPIIVLRTLSDMAKISLTEWREQVLALYFEVSQDTPFLLREAGWLWNKQELPMLRSYLESQNFAQQRIAASALAQLGERQDVDLITASLMSRKSA